MVANMSDQSQETLVGRGWAGDGWLSHPAGNGALFPESIWKWEKRALEICRAVLYNVGSYIILQFVYLSKKAAFHKRGISGAYLRFMHRIDKI